MKARDFYIVGLVVLLFSLSALVSPRVAEPVQAQPTPADVRQAIALEKIADNTARIEQQLEHINRQLQH